MDLSSGPGLVALRLVGVAGLLTAAWLLLRPWTRLRRTGRRTTGTVVGHRTTGPPREPVHAPVFRFTTGDGRTVEAVASVSAARATRVGREIRVVYDPSDPEGTAEPVGSHRQSVAVGLLCAVVGTGLLVHTVTEALS
ncbi:DUF3592 domain-containing protein [Actinomadura sediminis]|uniref:DUF3592 domain-containing protein n=1 Tax=Actinomadura sediminis TaxID=1038904 RepID=A0ABW3EN75_9ACTN